MNKNVLKKAVALILAAASISVTGVSVYASNDESDDYSIVDETNNADSDIAPVYDVISITYTYLKKKSSDCLHWEASTSVPNGYKASVKADLQQYKNGWTTIKSWVDIDDNDVLIGGDYYVEKGYQYRLRTNHYAYDSVGDLVDGVVKYSDVVQ